MERKPLVLVIEDDASAHAAARDCDLILADQDLEDGTGGEAIGRAIVELLADPALRAACGETLRKRVETYFTSELSAARYSALYEELVA